MLVSVTVMLISTAFVGRFESSSESSRLKLVMPLHRATDVFTRLHDMSGVNVELPSGAVARHRIVPPVTVCEPVISER